jgi:hypothetical protein
MQDDLGRNALHYLVERASRVAKHPNDVVRELSEPLGTPRVNPKYGFRNGNTGTYCAYRKA